MLKEAQNTLENRDEKVNVTSDLEINVHMRPLLSDFVMMIHHLFVAFYGI